MKDLNKKAKRIIENLFDVMLQTSFKEIARKELDKDLRSHNVFIDKNKGLIEIQNREGTKTLYKITIEKV